MGSMFRLPNFRIPSLAYRVIGNRQLNAALPVTGNNQRQVATFFYGRNYEPGKDVGEMIKATGHNQETSLPLTANMQKQDSKTFFYKRNSEE